MTSTFALAFAAGFVTLLTLLLMAMPAITPATVPLGVAIPPARIGDPAVRRTLARFRIGLVGAWIVALAVATPLAFTAPFVGIIVPVFVLLVLGIVVLIVSRRGIIAAKRAGDWYAGVALQRSAEVTAPERHHPPVVWGVVAIVAFAVAFAIGAAAYPGLPDPIATHFDAAGAADRFEPKSVWSVFGLLLIAVAVVVVIFALAVAVPRMPLRTTPGDDPQGALGRAAARRGVLAALLAQLSAAIAVGLSLLAVLIWLAPEGVASRLGLIVMIVLIFATLAVSIARFRRIARPATGEPGSAAAAASRPAAPDDDTHWKGGIIYVNRDDPAIWVPRRFGLGWTLNLGRPAGIAVGVLTIVVIVGVVLTLILTTGHGR